MFDPDDTPETNHKVDAFQSLLEGLEAENLRGWDRDFIDDLVERAGKRGYMAVMNALTGSQLDQLERIKEQYDYEETGKENFLD